MEGPVEEVCTMIDDWDTRHNRVDMPEEVWNFLKENKFLGMLISKKTMAVLAFLRRLNQ